MIGRRRLCIARGKDPVLGRVIAQSSYQLIGFLRGHLVDVLAQLVDALNFTQKAISHRRRPFSRLRLRWCVLSCLLCYRQARGFSRSSAARGRIGWGVQVRLDREWPDRWRSVSAARLGTECGLERPTLKELYLTKLKPRPRAGKTVRVGGPFLRMGSRGLRDLVVEIFPGASGLADYAVPFKAKS